MQAIATPMTQAMKEWTKIFPINVTESYTSSVTFMKQLTVVAISTITFLKDFPDDSYTFEHFAGLKLRILKKRCRDEFADFVSTSLQQAFEAFDKKYLHQLAICFYKGEFTEENLLEYHIFEYTYNKEGVSMSLHSKSRDSSRRSNYSFENVRESTVKLIRACLVLMQSSPYNSSDCRDVSIRLYYNEDAPKGYNVEGFAAATPAEDHVGARRGGAVSLGRVRTNHHALRASCYFRDALADSGEAVPSQNPPMMTQMDDEFEERPQVSPALSSEHGNVVRCPCNRQDVDEHTPMLTCLYCNTRQHAACFGLLSAEGRATHCCERCYDDDNRRGGGDRRLAALTQRKRECLCIYRLALALCRPRRALSASQLSSRLRVSPLNAAKLLRLLHSHGVIAHRAPDMTTPIPINVEQLNATIGHFFQTPDNDIVDRLLAETFASQESTPDPVGDVLKPLEKVSLQNEDNLGRVIENPVQPPVSEDSTLLQYREAVLSNYQRDDELPLSGSHNPVKDMDNIGKKLGKRRLNDENERPRLRSSHKAKRAKKV